jgi:hypothetical protein
MRFVKRLSANDDGTKRSPGIHWPAGFSPDDADMFAHNEIYINASCATVWRHLVEAPKWPLWYSNSQDVHILNDRTGLLQQDSRFEFNTFGMHIDAEVSEYVPNSRLGWFGKGTDVNAYHTWLFAPLARGCQVVTEEVAKGPGAIGIRKSDPNAMYKGHELWVTSLKQLSEK